MQHERLADEGDRDVLGVVDNERFRDLSQQIGGVSSGRRGAGREQSYLELAHDPLAAPVTEVLADGKVVKVMRAFVCLNKVADLLQDGGRHTPSLLRLDVVEERTSFRLRLPERFARLDDREPARIEFGVCLSRLGDRLMHRCSRFWAEKDVRRKRVLVLPLIAHPPRVEGSLHAENRPHADPGG